MIDSYIYLKEWACIMIIIVCFTILLTLFAYSICFLISKFKKFKKNKLFKYDKAESDNIETGLNQTPLETTKQIQSYSPTQTLTNKLEPEPNIKSETLATVNEPDVPNFFSSVISNIKSMLESPINKVPSIGNLNKPDHIITVKKAITSGDSSSDESDYNDNFKSTTLNKLERRFKKRNETFKRHPQNTVPLEASNRVLTSSRKTSNDSNSTRKSSVESNYYQSSVFNLYR